MEAPSGATYTRSFIDERAPADDPLPFQHMCVLAPTFGCQKRFYFRARGHNLSLHADGRSSKDFKLDAHL